MLCVYRNIFLDISFLRYKTENLLKYVVSDEKCVIINARRMDFISYLNISRFYFIQFNIDFI